MSAQSYQELVGKPSFLSKETYGVVILCACAFAFSVMGVYVKLAIADGLTYIELVFIRAVFQVIVVMAAMTCFTEDGSMILFRPFGAPRVQWLVICRGMIGGMGYVFYFYTVNALPLGDATVFLSLSPIITVFASALFIGETLYASHILAACTSVAGSVLIAKPTLLFGSEISEDESAQISNSTGYVTALMCTCCATAVYILIRQAGKSGVHTLQLLFSWCFFGILYSTIIILYQKSFVVPPSREAVWYLFWTCISGMFAHFFMNYAARFAPPGLTAIIRTSGIIWAYTFEVLVFDQIPDWLTILGAFLVIISAVVVTLQKESTSKAQDEEEATALLASARIESGEALESQKTYGSST